VGQVEKDIFKDRLNGGILIDLGFGKVPLMKALATRYKSKTYIGVDRYSIGKEDESSDPHKVMDDLSKNDIQAILVKSDLLDFASRIPDNSVNFTINGIDKNIIPDEDYQKALVKEMIRATKKGGIIFGFNSDAIANIREGYNNEEGTDLILQKMEELLPIEYANAMKDSGIFEKNKIRYLGFVIHPNFFTQSRIDSVYLIGYNWT